MIKVYPYEELGHANHGWLDTRHHFSFANYYNPERMGLGTLRVINDDVIKAGAGFDAHPHRNMEIITYIRQGAITHKDSQGNEGRTEAGDIQVMSAGTGIFHSEYNLESIDTNIYQIWIEPNKTGVRPRWDQREFPKELKSDGLELLVSGRREDKDSGALYINQNASIYGGRLREGSNYKQPIINQAYLLVSDGFIEVDGQEMKQGDGAVITDSDYITIAATSESEVLLIDIPNKES